jgi:hypothetical protein
MTEAKQKQRNWTKIGMIAGGVVLLIAVVIAVLNTYTDLFEDSFKPKPEPKQVASNLKYGEPDNVNDDTPAKEFTDEVIAAYSEFEKVSAQMLLGSECSAQIHINGGTDAKWRINKASGTKTLKDIRKRAAKHSKSQRCVVSVVFNGDVVMLAKGKGNKTQVDYLKKKQ